MRDIKTFCKLFPAKIPVERHANYYIRTLGRSLEYFWLEKAVRDFGEYEESLGDPRVNLTTVYGQKNKILDDLAGTIRATKAFERFNTMNLASIRDDEDVNRKVNDKIHGKGFELGTTALYVKMDIVSANWTVLKMFDFDGELPETWDQFCLNRNVPDIFLRSKALRQHVFGNLNPKRSQSVQSAIMQRMAPTIPQNLPLGTILADELTVIVSDRNVAEVDNFINTMTSAKMSLEGIHTDHVKFKFTLFSRDELSKWAGVSQIYENTNGKLVPLYKTLYGIPGNKYFLYFKPFILGEEVEQYDKLFVNDGLLCQWAELPDDVIDQQTIIRNGQFFSTSGV